MEKLLRIDAVSECIGMGRSWIYQKMKEGSFPKSVKVGGGRSTAWSQKSIDAWITAQVEQSQKVEEE